MSEILALGLGAYSAVKSSNLENKIRKVENKIKKLKAEKIIIAPILLNPNEEVTVADFDSIMTIICYSEYSDWVSEFQYTVIDSTRTEIFRILDLVMPPAFLTVAVGHTTMKIKNVYWKKVPSAGFTLVRIYEE